MSDTNTNTDVIDGFSDDLREKGTPVVDAADKGHEEHAAKPLSPEEYAKLQKDARDPHPADGHPEKLKE